MGKSAVVIVGEAVELCLDGTEAQTRYTGNVRVDLVCLASSLTDIGRTGRAWPGELVDLIRAAYHLGREQALERVAIGLDMEEGICLGDEPKPPQRYER